MACGMHCVLIVQVHWVCMFVSPRVCIPMTACEYLCMLLLGLANSRHIGTEMQSLTHYFEAGGATPNRPKKWKFCLRNYLLFNQIITPKPCTHVSCCIACSRSSDEREVKAACSQSLEEVLQNLSFLIVKPACVLLIKLLLLLPGLNSEALTSHSPCKQSNAHVSQHDFRLSFQAIPIEYAIESIESLVMNKCGSKVPAPEWASQAAKRCLDIHDSSMKATGLFIFKYI